MTSKNDTPKPPGKAPSESSGPKKPSPLLDLKATEVKSSEPKSSAASASGGPESPARSASAAATAPASAAKSDEKGAAPDPAASATTKPEEAVAKTGSVPSASEKGGKPVSQDQAPAQKPGAAQAAKDPKPNAAPKHSGGFGRLMTHLAAGIAGGFLALLLADSLGPQLGLDRRAPQQVLNELQQRLSAAEKAIREQAATPGVSTTQFEQKLADVQSRLARLDEINRALGTLSEAQTRIAGETKSLGERISQSSPTSEMTERITKLEQVLATLTAAAGSEQPGRIPQLAAISGKLADLEATIPNQMAELRKSVNQEIEARLAQTAEASEAARSGTLRMDRELAASKADLARLSQRAEALKSADDRLEQFLRALQEEAGSLRSAVTGLQSELATQLKTVARAQDVTAAMAPVESRIAALEQSVQTVVKSEDDRRTNAERIVLALELGNLKRALERGGSYTAELSELSKIGAGKVDLAVLERYKAEGVPTRSELVEEFRPVAHAIIDAATVPADASAFDRLLIGAKSIVRVRRTEHSPDDTSVEAVVSRMEKALSEGKFTEVLAQSKQLPPYSADAAEAWLAKVEARAAVDRALASVEDQLKASLSGKAPVEKRTQ